MDEKRYKYLSVLVGELSNDYYMRVFEKIDAGRLLPSPNIAAGIFGLFWLIYRKMTLAIWLVYIPAFVLGVMFVDATFDTRAEVKENWWCIFIIPHLVLFLVGNNIYYLRLRRWLWIQRARNAGTDEQQFIPYLSWKGGTTPGMPLILKSLIWSMLLGSFIFGGIFAPSWWEATKRTIINLIWGMTG